MVHDRLGCSSITKLAAAHGNRQGEGWTNKRKAIPDLTVITFPFVQLSTSLQMIDKKSAGAPICIATALKGS